jgi:hypothetical protein
MGRIGWSLGLVENVKMVLFHAWCHRIHFFAKRIILKLFIELNLCQKYSNSYLNLSTWIEVQIFCEVMLLDSEWNLWLCAKRIIQKGFIDFKLWQGTLYLSFKIRALYTRQNLKLVTGLDSTSSKDSRDIKFVKFG